MDIIGTASGETLIGTSGDDNIDGLGGDDTLIGDDGNDALDGGAGNDVMHGGNGDDAIRYLADPAAIDFDSAHGGANGTDPDGDVLFVDFRQLSVATMLSGTLTASAGTGWSGQYVSSAGHQISFTGIETFVMWGGSGVDDWKTGSGADLLLGGAGDDRIDSGSGNDIIDGQSGADMMIGGFGNDIYYTDVSGDVIVENVDEGTDEVWTNRSYTLGANVENLKVYAAGSGLVLTGNGLDNQITGTGFTNDILDGGAGNDRLDGGGGADRMTGGSGNDIFIVNESGDLVIEAANGGTDEVLYSFTSYTLAVNVENATATSISQTFLTGNGLNNVLKGSPGWDDIDGGAGADVMIGYAGNDWYTVDNAGDQIVEVDDSSGGFDSVETSLASYTLQPGLELVRGNSSKQTLTGNDGDNWLDSQGGGDTLIGGKGNDLYVTFGGDIIVEYAGEGIDLVRTTAASYTLPENFEELQGTSFSIGQTLIGNAANNRIIGTIINDRSDTIDGGLGADLMIGWHGSDVYYVDNIGDTIVEEAHHGTADEVRTTINFTAPTNVELLTAWSDGGLALTGNGLANIVRGRNGNDVLDGAGGADQLIGGLGDDLYRIDASDTVVEAAGGGFDTVEAGFTTTLGAELEALVLTGTASINGTGNGLANSLTGNSGANRLTGGLGNDLLVGGGGTDTAAFSGNRADYVIDTSNLNAITVRDLNAADGDDGTDTLSGIRFIQFANMIVDMGVDPNNPPVLGQPAMEDQVWDDSEAASYTIPGTAFFDLDANDTLTFQARLSNGSPLPAWLTFDASTRTFSGTPPVDQIGVTIEVIVTASDGKASVSDNMLFAIAQAPGADVNGTVGADVLEGTFRAETMFGDDGDDILRGSAGADRVNGGAGTDGVDYSLSPQGVTVDLSSSFVIGHGGDAEGDEYIAIENATGSSHDDHIIGNAGNNVLDGGGGADLLAGLEGDDLYILSEAGDIVNEQPGAGTDTVQAAFSYTLGDWVENLVLLAGAVDGSGNGLANSLTGNDSANSLDGKGGADAMAGGLGDDVYVVDDAGDAVTELGGQGSDEIRTALAAYSLAAAANVEKLTGLSDAGQTLTGNDLANVIKGGWGADLIDGGLGADDLRGSLGNDVYLVDNGGDTVTEGEEQGLDEVRTNLASFSIASFANVENLTGGAADQTLTGNGFNNLIDGGAGADTMAGGGGHDVYIVDNLGDVVIEADGAGVDEVRTGLGSKAPPERAVYVLPNFVENLTGTSAGAQGVRDNALNNVISMGAGHDLVVADAGGVDTISGGGGNDFIYYGDKWTAADITNGGAGTDTISLIGNYASGIVFTATNLIGVERMALYSSLYLPGTGPNNYNVTMDDANVAAGTEFFVTAASLQSNESLSFNGSAETNGKFTVHGGGGNDTITGGTGSDFFLGNAGNDSLNGGGGNDFLYGGLGADLLTGGGGFDAFRYQSATHSTAASMDHILDFTDLDRIDLSAIDANGNAGDGNQAFSFIGSSAFGNVAGQLRAYQNGADWFVEGDTNGDGVADLVIQVTITDPTLLTLGASDFNF